MPAILIVCTANQCRSPLGQVLLQRLLDAGYPQQEWRVESAGTWAINGRTAHPDMRAAATEAGLNLQEHRARNVDSIALEKYDLLLTMEQSHKEALQIEFPAIRQRVHLLSEMLGVTYDVPDPIGGPLDDYRATVRELDRLFKFALPRIAALATNNAAVRVG
jgi:protein-tyrosine-phosphatase